MSEKPMSDFPTLISTKEVIKRTTLCRGTIRNLVNAGDFPRPIRLTENRIAFREAEVTAWLAARLQPGAT